MLVSPIQVVVAAGIGIFLAAVIIGLTEPKRPAKK